jgi:hypothetical protein
MKKVNIYIITYNNPERLNQNIERLVQSTLDVDSNEYQLGVVIINNHPNFSLDEKYKGVIRVWHNVTRPEFSCGHLSRDYNAAYMHGFRDLKNPAVDYVVCIHDDTMLKDGWFQKLMQIHETYNFYAGDYGCSMTSVNAEAVRTIGIWDERFCNIGYHEADMFLRALIYNKDKSSINDHLAGRVHNPTEVLFDHPPENHNKVQHINHTLNYHTVSRKVFAEKWGVHPEFWENRLPVIPTEPKIDQYMYYPYFELDIYDLDAKKYIYAKAGLEHFLPEWR